MRLFLLCLLLPVALCACSTTKAASAGADDVAPTDAVYDTAPADASDAPDSAPDAVTDIAVDAAADSAPDAAMDVPADVSPLGPATWSGIYADYFSPSGVATCGGAGCHSAPTDAGVIVSSFVCTDQAGCYTSLFGKSKMILPTDFADPTKSKLMRNLRQAGNAGKMPSGAVKYVFSSADVARIAAWISAGAKND